MRIETKFSNGDTVYVVQQQYLTDKPMVIGPMTIGQVRVSITDSPGVDGEEIFSNFMPMKETEEQYMCIETGIGTGTLYSAEMMFSTKEEAQAKL